jgi:dihydroorotase (multifunctional complex type)
VTLDLVVRGGRCVLPDGIREADLGVAAGRIAAIAPPGQLAGAATVIEAAGFLVLPGVLDAHVHVRDPGQTHKEDYAHATRAAAAGGVTTIVSQPNTEPPVTDARGFAAVAAAARASRVDHAVCAGVSATAPDAAAARAVAEAGAVAFEVLGDPEPLDRDGWRAVCDAVAPTGLPLACLATDRALLREGLARVRARPAVAWRDWSTVVTGEAEVAGFGRIVAAAPGSGVPLIVRQVTTAAGLDYLRRVKREGAGAPVWVEVNVHHLFLTDEDLARLGPYGQMLPPLRPAADVAALWDGLADGTVDFVSTDHAPHTREEKERGRADPWTSAPTGIPGLDTLLCLVVDGALAGRLSLARAVELLAVAPARIHRLAPAKGALAIGADADVVVVDPAREWTIDAGRILSRCGWSAFEGRRGRGLPVATLLRGRVVAREGRPLDEPIGRLLTPGSPRP